MGVEIGTACEGAIVYWRFVEQTSPTPLSTELDAFAMMVRQFGACVIGPMTVIG